MSKIRMLSEDLIGKIAAGDRLNAVEDLHALIGGRLRFVAVRFFRNDFDADDAVQDFWANIVTYAVKCRYTVNTFSYLMKCFENQCKMTLRKKNARKNVLSVEDVDRYESLSSDGGLNVRQIALKQTFLKAQKRMTDDERRVFAFVLYDEATVRDVAKELNMSKSQVARVRQSAMQKLEQALREDGWDKNGN